MTRVVVSPRRVLNDVSSSWSLPHLRLWGHGQEVGRLQNRDGNHRSAHGFAPRTVKPINFSLSSVLPFGNQRPFRCGSFDSGTYARIHSASATRSQSVAARQPQKLLMSSPLGSILPWVADRVQSVRFCVRVLSVTRAPCIVDCFRPHQIPILWDTSDRPATHHRQRTIRHRPV